MINNILKKYPVLIVIIMCVLAITGFSFIMFESISADRQFQNAQFNKIVSQMLLPSLEISDTMEINNILKLASDKNHFLAVIDSNADIITPNYANIDRIQSTFKIPHVQHCTDIQSTDVNCHTLHSRKNPEQLLGLSLSFAHYETLPIVKKLLFSSGILLLIVVGLIALMMKRMMQQEKKVAMTELAEQLAHDIRSPLAALTILIQVSPELPDNKRALTQQAIERIHAIANDLLNSAQQADKKTLTSCSIYQTLHDIITEKNITAAINFSAENNAKNSKALIHAQEFKRVMSNLLNNAIEATKNTINPAISVSLASKNHSLIITINDNGCGIPDSVMQNLGKRRNTAGKENGNGLGLSHALHTIRALKGDIKIETSSEGTTLTITLHSL